MAKTNPQSSGSTGFVASSCTNPIRTPKSQSPKIKIKIERDSETGTPVKEHRPLLKIVITRDRNASNFASYGKGTCLFITPDMWPKKQASTSTEGREQSTSPKIHINKLMWRKIQRNLRAERRASQGYSSS